MSSKSLVWGHGAGIVPAIINYQVLDQLSGPTSTLIQTVLKPKLSRGGEGPLTNVNQSLLAVDN